MDEELLAFINSVESGDEDFSSDDSIMDEDFVMDNIEPRNSDPLSQYDEQAIEECIQQMNEANNTDEFLQAIKLTLNISQIEQSSASSSFVDTQDIANRKEDRGFSIEYMTSIQGVDLNTVLWNDNKCVRLAST